MSSVLDLLLPSGKMTSNGIMHIFTPQKVVQEMVDLLPEEVWNSSTTFLDIACKSGVYLVEIYKRLMKTQSLIDEYPDPEDREDHIFSKQLFGIALDIKTMYVSQAELYGMVGLYDNIKTIDGYTKIIKTRGIKDTASKIKETLNEMRFDVVIGNPPYQDEKQRSNGGGGDAIYPLFMGMANELTNQYSTLVIPSLWMTAYPTGSKHQTVDELRKNLNIIKIHDFKNAKEVFNNVSIPSGVCYYLAQKTVHSKCEQYIHEIDGNVYMIKAHKLFNEDANIIFRDNYLLQIIAKIKIVDGEKYKKFAEICGGKHFFDDADKVMVSNWKEYSLIQDSYYNIKYYVNNRTHNIPYGYVNISQVPKRAEYINKHKILIGQAFSAGSPQVMDKPLYVGVNCLCSQSFIPIFSKTNTEEECKTICKYMCTKLFRYLVNVLKSGQNLGNKSFKLVPMQDFTSSSDIDWSKSIEEIDKQLYTKYNLTEEEIDYIESTIKPMK